MNSQSSTPAISVVIVSDYAAGDEGEWVDLRKSLAGLAAQDIEEPVEFIFCESDELRDRVPANLTDLLPGLKIIFADGSSSYALKNAGVEAASCELVATLDADCVPRPDWLRLLLAALRARPEAAAISGKTTYGGGSLAVRTSCLFSRAFADPGGPGTTRFICSNNAGYRRSAYLAHPSPTNMGAFAAHVQSQQLRGAGFVLWFEPTIRVEHDFEGWPMEKDFRRTRGFSTIKTRLMDHSLPYAWLVRAGMVGIPPIVAWKILASWFECVRCGSGYGIRWYEQPLVMTAAIGLCMFEIPGMVTAFQGKERGVSQFR
jgi:hypothetical protein